MSVEARILALFEEGNPIPDLDTLARADIDATAYLEALTARSDEMTQVKEPVDRQDSQHSRSWVMLSVAAILVVLAGVAAILLLATNDAPVVDVTTTTPAIETEFDGYWDSGSQQLVIDRGVYWVIERGGLVDTGEFRAGASVFFTSSAASPSCAEGMVGIGAPDMADDGQSFSVRLVETDCGPGFAYGDTFTRTAPFEIPESAPPTPQADGTDASLIGRWRGSGIEIEFLDSDSYVIYIDGEIFDQGGYEVGAGGSDFTPGGSSIVLRSDADSPSCDAGDELVSTYESYGQLGFELHSDECSARLGEMLPFMTFSPTG